MATGGQETPGAAIALVDRRAVEALPHAARDVAEAWRVVRGLTESGPVAVGLAAGERPIADVDVLAGVVAVAEFELARRMHAASSAGCLPLPGPGVMLGARGWSGPSARRLARAGALAADHVGLAAPWAAGLITAEHVDAVARHAEFFTDEELAAVISELGPHWGSWSPAAVNRFVAAAARMLHPPDDPSPTEADAHECRSLSFAITSDTVILSGELPRIEGEVVIAAIDAFAERLRSTADHVPASARRADALVELVNSAHATSGLPSRGGLPVSLSVTLDRTCLGDPIWSTSRGHSLTEAEARWACCDAALTPILVESGGCEVGSASVSDGAVIPPDQASPAARIAALAAAMFDSRIPLAVGRTQRTATPAQRRALAVRDGGCVIPGCGIPAEACQTHHLTEWADGGSTDLPNMALLCWAHHRQVDLRMWTIHPSGSGQEPTPRAGRPSESGAPPETPWPANHGAPFTITRTPRTRWRT